ncbi:nitroreductase [Actinoplanes hulinensis]|uniref:nitroreductase n=1 Tax=Actinoplanes hulinensis TaxID=1144547 RepID=UPI001C6648CC|nr:nitroreductase [Actinoplanes hulinensis]
MTSVRRVDRRVTNEAFYRAVVAAQQAPSAYGTQPWRWQVANGVLDLFAHTEPSTGCPGPDERLATIGCGAALHHARLTLAARGWRVTTTRLPDPTEPAHLARLHIDGPAPVSPGTAHLARTIKLRHTDRRPITGQPITPEHLSAIRSAFESQHTRLAVLRPDQILDLAVATAHADDLEPAGWQWQSELALWAGAGRIVGALHRVLLHPALDGHDRAATFAVLHGPGDQSLDLLHAGEALSAGSLVAAELDVSTLSFSAPIEQDRARDILRDAIPDLGHPYLMVRLGHHAPEAWDTISTASSKPAVMA